ncbi:unnamed protein product [Ceutorhynchus assimilis]|uniref:Peptidase S1 domain-containing protein n=1 Tax=Ceutorhynchus assimilis TaxID=467358 RepID=A0A9N9QRH3_9CUCU|nr:unnamed protein product [Ceutorhynchus assimilis]
MRFGFWAYFLLIILVSLVGSEDYGQSKNPNPAKHCNNYVVVVAAIPAGSEQKPTPVATATLISDRIGLGDLGATAQAASRLFDPMMPYRPRRKTIVIPPYVPPQEYHHVHEESHVTSSYTQVNETYITITTYNTNITNYHLNETFNNISNVQINENIITKNISIDTINLIDYDINDIKSFFQGILGRRAHNHKGKNIIVFRLQKSVFSIMPYIKLVTLPVPKNLRRSIRFPLNWPRSQNKPGGIPKCGSFATYGFGKSSKQNVLFTDRKGTPLELQCFVDSQGNAKDFSNCAAPQTGPIMCGEVQVGILVDGNECHGFGRQGGRKAVDFVPIETIFNFVVDFMEGEEAGTTPKLPIGIERSTNTGVYIQFNPNVLLILAIIIVL